MDKGLYVDVSHDNDMVGVFSAMGLFDGVPALPTDRRVEPEEVRGFAAGWVVPFAARAYVEKMVCGGEGEEEMVRVVVNNRVVPLTQCGGDAIGRCTLERFVGSLEFARKGGKWAECFDQGGGGETGVISSGNGSDGIAAEVESA